MDSVQVGDGTLSAQAQGGGEALLMIHGAMIADSYGLMLDQGDLIGSFQVITFHRRGFGGSTAAVADHTIADEAADALAVLDHYGIDTAHVVGHSYGGAVALQLAIDAPDRVGSLGLFEPALLTVPAAAGFGEGVGPVAEKFAADDHPGALLGFLELVGGPDPMSRLTKLSSASADQALVDLPTLFSGDLPALSGWSLSDDQLRSITQPALTVLGTDSAEVFAQGIAHMNETLADTESLSLDGAAHFLQMEKPAEATAGLQAFLLKHPINA